MTPEPSWKSRYSLPSNVPDPRALAALDVRRAGSLFWNWDGTPPGVTRLARAKYSPERRVRSASIAFSRSVSAGDTGRSMAFAAGVVVVHAILASPQVRLTRGSGRQRTGQPTKR